MKPVDAFHTARRNLPHWQAPGATNSIAWRTRPGLTLAPAERSFALDAVRHWDGNR